MAGASGNRTSSAQGHRGVTLPGRRIRACGDGVAVLQHRSQLRKVIKLYVKGGPFSQCCFRTQGNLRQHARLVALSFTDEKATDLFQREAKCLRNAHSAQRMHRAFVAEPLTVLVASRRFQQTPISLYTTPH